MPARWFGLPEFRERDLKSGSCKYGKWAGCFVQEKSGPHRNKLGEIIYPTDPKEYRKGYVPDPETEVSVGQDWQVREAPMIMWSQDSEKDALKRLKDWLKQHKHRFKVDKDRDANSIEFVDG